MGDESLGDARREAQRELRFELAAAKMCREQLGFGASFTRTADGAVVCIPPLNQPKEMK